MAFFEVLWQDLLAVLVVVAVGLAIYARAKRLTFREVVSQIRELFG